VAALASHPALGLDRARAAELLDPTAYLGAAETFVDKARANYERDR
jgi:hypothetical protein